MSFNIDLTNPRRKKQIEEFVDKHHPVASKFFEIMEKNLTPTKLQKELEQIIQKDPEYFEPYPILAGIYLNQNKSEEALILILAGFKKAVLKIADKEGNWPKVMEWGWHENRHLMTMLSETADLFWMMDKTEEALAILRKLLKCNPGDNQGVRYSILAILLKLPYDNWDESFRVSVHGFSGWGSEITDWFDKEAKQFPEEFDWLFEEWKKYE